MIKSEYLEELREEVRTEARAEGKTEALHQAILSLGRQRFGRASQPQAEIAQFQAVTDAARLGRIPCSAAHRPLLG